MYVLWLVSVLVALSFNVLQGVVTDVVFLDSKIAESPIDETVASDFVASTTASSEQSGVVEDAGLLEDDATVEERMKILAEVIAAAGLDISEAAAVCRDCEIDARNTYIYDQGINDAIPVEHESFALFEYESEAGVVSDVDILRTLEALGWVQGHDYEPRLILGDAGGPTGNSTILVAPDGNLSSLQLLGFRERSLCKDGEAWGVGDGCSVTQIVISVPEVVDVSSYY